MPHGKCVALLCALAAASALAQTAPDPQVYRVGGGVTPPVLIHKAEPEYTEQARKAKLQGAVLLAVVIGADGAPRDLTVTKALGLGLDEMAIDAVSRWQFRPGQKDGNPVAVQATIEVNFRLLEPPSAWYPTRVAFSVPQGVTPPQVVNTYFPPADGLDDSAVMRLSFDIDADGHPQNVHIDSASDHRWDDEVMAMISQWRFQSALDHGGAVESKGYIDLQRGLNPNLPAPLAAPRMKQ